MSEVNERELGWDDDIEKDGSEFILLPEGDYDFEVSSFERGRFAGSEKMPACNKAMLKLRVETDNGPAFVNHQLLLHTRTEGMLSAFFAAIGQKKKGEKMTMNWPLVPGSSGRAKIGIRTYKPEGGEERQYNEVKKFYPKEEVKFEPGRF